MAERRKRSLARSVKKNPFCKDGQKSKKIPKRFSNKAVRHILEIPSGKCYKKYYCSWNICDYISYWSWEQAKQSYKAQEGWQKSYPTLKEFYKFWRHYYKNK